MLYSPNKMSYYLAFTLDILMQHRHTLFLFIFITFCPVGVSAAGATKHRDGYSVQRHPSRVSPAWGHFTLSTPSTEAPFVFPEHPYCRSNNYSLVPSANKLEVAGEMLKKHVQALRRTPSQKIELVFLVDSSLSVGAKEFANELKFVKKLLSDFTVDRHTTRVSVITFSSSSRIVRNIDHLSHPSDEKHKCSLIEEELPRIEYTGGGTYTIGAVIEAQNVFKEARPDAKKALFLVTDGYSNGGDPRPTVEALKKNGVEVFTFGIKQGNFRELCDMASERKEEHTYILDTFDEFEALARRALHEDLHIGNYIIQKSTKCNSLCEERQDCCDTLATCQCGTHTGRYECICQAGYYGNGLKRGCQPCPEGTYKNYTGPGDKSTCMICPDPNHVSPPGSVSIYQCECRKGYKPMGLHACAAMTCPELQLPENGYFVHAQCSNNVNAACGIRCKVGYSLLGSGLRLCTEDGTWSGTDTICEVRRCSQLQAPPNGNMACTKEDFSFDTNCHFSCNPGYKLVGSKSQTCLAIAHWSGIPPKCREVKCPELSAVVDGKVSPETCTSRESSFGTICTFGCRPGYKLVGPQTKQCLENSKWSPDDAKDSLCVDVTPPTIKCPPNLKIEAAKDENIGHAWWELPIVEDNSGYIPMVTVIPALIPPVFVPIGNNTVTYIAEDAKKNKARCSFTITVVDEQPPRIDKCISPPPFIRRSSDIKITWDEPIFSDNSHEPVRITQSHKPGIFPLGMTQIYYTAFDSQGNNITCIIEITVQEHACSNHPVPAYGDLSCHSQMNGVECSPSCRKGYSFAIRPSEKYYCDYDNGEWTPSGKWPVKDCSVSEKSNQVKQTTDMRFKLDSSCWDRMMLNQIENSFEEKIKNKVSMYCKPNVICNVEQFETNCIDEATEERKNQYEIESNRVENENFLMIGRQLPGSRRKRRDLVPPMRSQSFGVEFERFGVTPAVIAKSAINVRFDVTGSVNNSGAQPDLRESVSFVMDQIRSAAFNGEFDTILADEELHVVGRDVNVRDASYRCESGSVLRRDECVKCPGGTFYNVVTKDCEGCLKGTYQPEDGQLTCLVCPNNTSTANNNSKSIQQCRGQCLPGSFSADGVEWCETCPVGFFQPAYAQTMCLKCPDGTTTWRRGTLLVDECRVMCREGFVSKSGLEPCFPCPRGYYQPSRGKISCFSCPGNARTRNQASINITDCEGVSEFAASYSSTPTMQLPINDCFKEPCHNGAKCISLEAGYTCQCQTGWIGIHCDLDIDECLSNPCLNNGTCTDQFNNFNCTCQSGWEGLFCDMNIDECLSEPCQNNASCIDQLNAYYCDCPEGFSGNVCANNVDDCQAQPCKNGGVCLDGVAEYKCSCLLGFQGNDCEVNIDECQSSPCRNNGSCVDDINSYSCLCKPGYNGDVCEFDINECESMPCRNEATCTNNEAFYSCRCSPSYSGVNCEEKLNSSFDLLFPSSGITDYILIKDPFGDRNLTAVTIAVWIKTSDKTNQGTIMSYATNNYSNALVIMDGNGLVLYVNDISRVTDIEVNDGHWHHIVVTWSSINGDWNIYRDGQNLANGTGFMFDSIIEGGGILVLGQEQDIRGGKFSSSESYVGRISKLNIFDEEMTSSDIEALYGSCNEDIGNLIAWPDVLSGMNGRVTLLETSICKGCDAPDNIANGDVAWNGTDVNSTAQYSCTIGYELDGLRSRFCQIDSTWSGVTPRCLKVHCGDPEPVAHGSPTSSDYTYGYLRYTCHQGYKLVGNDSIYCNHKGKWEGHKPQCIEILCPVPQVLPSRLHISNQNKLFYKPTENIKFSCPVGYRLDGTQRIKCTATGQWENQFPTCLQILCSDPPKLLNGYTIANSNDLFTVNVSIRYECNSGYDLDPAATNRIKCGEDGNWSNDRPRCAQVVCPEPDKIKNGRFTTPHDATNDTGIAQILYLMDDVVQYHCVEGFKMTSSSDTIVCLNTSKWSSNAPTCVEIICAKPLLEENILFEAPLPSVYKSKGNFKCVAGHVLAGLAETECLITGQWSGTIPTCQPIGCTPLINIKNGFISGSSFFYNETVYYSCAEGYLIAGNHTRRCDEMGLWSGSEPECLPIKCPTPGKIQWGRVIGNDYFFDSVIEFYCDSGFLLVGAQSLRCTYYSNWSDNFPTCEQVTCPSPVSLENGIISGLGPYHPGSVVKYVCNEGFEIEHDRKSTRSCRLDGTWTGLTPKCNILNCTRPVQIEHGHIVADKVSYGSTVEYQCDSGYEPQGSTKRTCTNGKLWTGAEPSCRVSLCSEPGEIEYGLILGDSHQVGAVVTYQCKSGYNLVGVENRTCSENKNWTGSRPRCEPVQCDNPGNVIINGLITGRNFSYGAKIDYTCDEGYFIVGSSVRTCNSSGFWDMPVPICERVECPRPIKPAFCDVEGIDYRFNETIKYVCRAGFRLVGQSKRVCQSDQTWSGEAPRCQEIECPQLSNISNGIMLTQGLQYRNLAEYRCNSGYRLEGREKRECLLNGSWSHEEPKCTKVMCSLPPKVDYGIPAKVEVEAGAFMEYNCNDGYQLNEPAKLACTEFGNFSGKMPTCRKMSCPKPKPIANGSLQANDLNVGDVVRYTCNTGYELVGEREQICLESGKWSDAAPSCAKIVCPTPEFVPNAIVKSGSNDYGAAIKYECTEGHVLESGNTTRICQSNKTWSGAKPMCSKIICPPPHIIYGFVAVSAGDKSIEKFVLEIDRFVAGMTVYFDCEDGFRLNGLKELVCLVNSSWSGPIPSCQRVNCTAPNITNAVVTAPKGFTFGYRTIVSCQDGYSIVGPFELYCLANGSWSTKLPVCKPVSCPQIIATNELQTKIIRSNDESYTFGSIIGFSCNWGYELVGVSELTCLSSKKWSETLPSCKAIVCSPPLIQGAHSPKVYIYKDMYTIGENLTFDCNPGEELIGDKVLICNERRAWNGTIPTCQPVNCNLNAINNSVVNFNATTYPKGYSLTVVCAEGYKIVGSMQITCMETKQWSNDPPNCEAILCPNLNISHGKVVQETTGLTYTYGANVSFECDAGYKRVGNSHIICLKSSEWSAKVPECVRVSCQKLDIPGGVAVLRNEPRAEPKPLQRPGPIISRLRKRDVNVIFTSGDIVDIECQTGYMLSSNASKSVTCDQHGVWVGKMPNCDPVQCSEPAVNNSFIEVIGASKDESIDKYIFGVLIEFTCIEGYILVGPAENLCLSDGRWAEHFPVCEPIRCHKLKVNNAIVHGGVNATYKSKAKVECFLGFELFSDHELVCQADGRWSGSMPICQMVDCKIPNISHAKFSTATQKPTTLSYGHTLHIACVEGYDLKGPSDIVCNANKSWTPALPICQEFHCPQPALNSSHLKYKITKDGKTTSVFSFGTEITFSCDLGFILDDKASMQCDANKTWTNAVPNCTMVFCATPVIRNGYLKSSRSNIYTFGSSIRLACNPGFQAKGESELFCQPNGEWTAEFPTCVRLSCPEIPVIPHGTAIGQSQLFESVVAYVCESGYEISGNENITCMSSLQWSTRPTCLPVRCPVPDPIEHGEHRTTGLGGFIYGNILSYMCHRGYELDGLHELICLANGTWSGLAPDCRRVKCTHPPYVPNADLQGDSYLFGDSLILKCHEGYKLQGVAAINCLLNQTWSTVTAECKIVNCSEPPYVKHASPFLLTKYEYNSTATYSCTTGYELIGTMEAICLANGTWSPINTTCTRIKCPYPHIVKNGSIDTEGKNVRLLSDLKKYWPNGFIYNDTIRFACDKGFELTGLDVQVCAADGKWNGTSPDCEIITCLKPPKLFHSHYVLPPMRQIHTYANSLAVECATGYVQKGTGHVTCMEDKAWNVSGVVCEKVTCPPYSIIGNGTVSGDGFTYNARITFSCLEGFKLIGDNYLTCGQHGTWDGSVPFCAIVNCSRVGSSLENGYIEGTDISYKSVITYHCYRGFEPIGDVLRTCQADGRWSGRNAQCRIRTCEPLEQIKNGIVISNFTTYGSIAEYKCNVGYEIVGSYKHRLCDHNGMWTGAMPECRLIVCIQPPGLDNGYFVGDIFKYGSVIRYHCNKYYYLKGESERHCQEDKMWSGTHPVCDLKLCPEPSVAPFRKYIGTEFSVGRTIHFSCDEGYKLVGNKSLTCRDGISWSAELPTCTLVMCGKPPSFENAKIDSESHNYGDIVKYACKTGYKMIGVSFTRCLLNGFWSDVSANCERISCSEAPAVPNAKAVQRGHHVGDTVSYICNEGHEIHGNNLIECTVDGQWTGGLPRCEMIRCGAVPVIPYASTIIQKTTYGSKAFYECNRGYRLHGSSIVVCKANGSWAYNERPSCLPVDCGQTLSAPAHGGIRWHHGGISKTVFGSLATYYCEDGYVLTGEPVVECGEHGTWNKSLVYCSPITCPDPDPVVNGRAIVDEFIYNHEALYVCHEGFELIGVSRRVCQLNGTWSGRTPQCQLIYCDFPTNPQNGEVNVTGLHYGSVAFFWCSANYELVGNDTAVCGPSSWNSTTPECMPHRGQQNCSSLPLVKHAVIVADMFQPGDVVNLTCLPGFNANGPLNITCLDDLTWTQPHGTCDRISCGHPVADSTVVIMSGRFLYGDRVAYMCRRGLIPLTDQILTCLDTGLWDLTPQCGATCKFPCQNGGSCVSANKCKCPSGFGGIFCEIASCTLPCLNGGKCSGPYKCDCPYGYTGPRCEQPVCARQCENNGRCILPNRCFCPHGFIPPFCERSRYKRSANVLNIS